MSAVVNSMIGAQSDSTGGGAGGSESGEESGTSELRALQGTRLVFGSISVEVAAPEAVSSHRSSIGAIGSGLKAGADSSAANQGTVRRQSYIMPIVTVRRAWLWLEPVQDQVSTDVSRVVQTPKTDLIARGIAFHLLQMAK